MPPMKRVATRSLRLGRKAMIVLLGTVCVVAGTTTSAFASGTSPTTNGCYSTWGSTGTSAHCFNVTVTGNYRNHAACQSQPDKVSSWLWITAGSTVDNWGQLNCTFKITSSRIEFTG
ncbi:hypothetical protein GCM10009677_54290 [Sphaerisporangium rubeum]